MTRKAIACVCATAPRSGWRRRHRSRCRRLRCNGFRAERKLERPGDGRAGQRLYRYCAGGRGVSPAGNHHGEVAGQELAASVYDYDAAVGTVSIPGEQVNGDLEIMVSCAAAEDQPGQSGDDQKPGEDQPGQSGDDQQPGSDSQNQDQQQNQGGKDPQGSDSSVKTGDASTAGIWAVLAVAAAAGAAGVLVWRRKTVQK